MARHRIGDPPTAGEQALGEVQPLLELQQPFLAGC
jgi:hypothetical protein